MQLEGLLAEIEGSVRSQIALAGGDPAVEAAANAVMGALRPALQQAAPPAPSGGREESEVDAGPRRTVRVFARTVSGDIRIARAV